MMETVGAESWYHCPLCGQKLFKIDRGAYANGLRLKCKCCKQEIKIKIGNEEKKQCGV